jgi:hypothetical protein
MIGYVFYSGSKIINNKIKNVEYIDSDCKEIRGEDENGNSVSAIFNGGSDFIILQDDSVNKSIGQEIDTTGLEDCRNYFLKGKDEWYLEKINTTKEQNKSLQDTVNTQKTTIDELNKDMDTALLGIADVYEQILSSSNSGGTTA